MRGSRIFSQRGSNFVWQRYFSWWVVGWEDPNTTISGPSSARQRNAIWMAFRWRADDGPTLNAGSVALWFFRGSGPELLRTPIVCDFSGGWGSEPRSPPLWIRTCPTAWLVTIVWKVPKVDVHCVAAAYLYELMKIYLSQNCTTVLLSQCELHQQAIITVNVLTPVYTIRWNRGRYVKVRELVV